METVNWSVNWHSAHPFLTCVACRPVDTVRAAAGATARRFRLPSPPLIRIFDAMPADPALTAEQLRELLKMQPLPVEGGYFAEAYRSKDAVPKEALPACYPGERAISTAIYYMLTPDTFSAMHRLRGDEVYHFYLGDPVEMIQLKPNGTGEAVLLGQNIASGMRLQHVVPGGTWQGSRLTPGGKFALMGTTMAPGFDPQDYDAGKRAELIAQYPQYSALITWLTR
jgi:predicted cupin superfamily sugar epimerase